MVCAAVLSAGLAVSSLPAGALAVYAEENTQVQEVPEETAPAETSNAGEESAEPQPAAAAEANEVAETAPAAESVAEAASVAEEVTSGAAETEPATETEATSEVEFVAETEQPAAASPDAPEETPVDAAAESAPSVTEAPATETPADETTNTVSNDAPQGDAVETEAPAESAVSAADEETPGETTALTELASKAEAVAATEQADDDRENSEIETTEEAETSAGETVEEESVSENNTADTEYSTPVNEADNTDTEETEPEEDVEENTVVAEEEVSPALALRALAVSADAAAGTLEESEESGTQGSGETVKIQFDKTVHSVKVNGQDMVVFCMNQDLHWPHNTPALNAPENYTQVGTGLTEEQEKQLTTLLYAGYPYNGLSMFQIVDQAKSIDEDDFDKLLVPPAWIRSDFPDLGETQFTYKNVADGEENATKLKNFLETAMNDYFPNGHTLSGHTYGQITATTFWRAASVIVNYGYEKAIEAYNDIYGGSKGQYTKQQAYDNTSNAVWYLMKQFNIENNTKTSALQNDSLAEQLYNTATSGTANVLKAAPTADQINITGDNKFVYDDTTKLWKTGTFTLTAPVMHDFTLSLPAGITTETGSTVINAGESFVLMTNVKPAANSTASISADLSWIDGGLKRYTPADTKKAPDGKGFQDMIGVLIRSTPVTSSFSLIYEEPNKPDEKPNDKPEDNTEEKPEEKPEQKPEDNSGSNNEDTNKSDATEEVTDPTAPDKPTPDKNNPATLDNTTNNNTETTDPVTNNTTEPSDPVETKTAESSDPAVTKTTVVSTLVTNGTTAADEPAVINAAVSAPVVTETSAASAPQIVSTPVSKGQTIVTGDESQMGLYLSVFAAAAAGLAVWFARKHKHNYR